MFVITTARYIDFDNVNIDYWALLGKLAVIATILTAIFKFLAWWHAPKEKLVARVSQNRFTLPPTVEAEFAAAAKKVRDALSDFLGRYPKKKDGYDEPYSRTEVLASDVRYALETHVSLETRLIAGCWYARVDNNGKKRCSGVSLQLPHATVALIKRDNERDPQVVQVKTVIEIGDLRPRGHCDITAWTDQRLTHRDNYDAQLSHDTGVGKIFCDWRTTKTGWVFGTLVQRENVLSLLIPLILAALGALVAMSVLGSLSHVRKGSGSKPTMPSHAPSPHPIPASSP